MINGMYSVASKKTSPKGTRRLRSISVLFTYYHTSSSVKCIKKEGKCIECYRYVTGNA